ncbi:Arm DNA-binding domain-containing protein [Paenibacillus larvae]|nr:Arm DNA-binding domain-containing protein [Paenibacillus larvae]MDT2238481.1 Arm DNA-binding domain-containing protein [Paenibacillus larvae]MDT2248856.1 Arm DNA-binding domain-containing protein [Paenibacillus larvae]MDT2265737.1 Arm DNA-binding domain-containing protein [Paenibacillus larvae]
MKGSIKKRGTKWSYIVDVGFDENGKRKQKTKSGFRTKAEAQAACNELINQINKGQYVEEKRMTLEEYLLLWLKDYAKPNMRQTSYDLREVLITKRIIPALGKYEIQK